jgi:hypothetical protein
MYKTRRFRDTPESHEREMAELKRKVPHGSKLRERLYGGDYEPVTYDAFIDAVLKYQSIMTQPKADADSKDAARRVDAAGVAESWQGAEGEQEWWAEDWDQSQEAAGRLGDSRMIGGGRGGKGRASSSKGGTRPKGVEWHPVCSKCTGRHEPWIECPNHIAQKRGFDANKHPGVKCDFVYKDRNHDCRGVGHLKADHAVALSQALAKGHGGNQWKGQGKVGQSKGSAPYTPKGASKGSKGKGKGGKGKGRGASRLGA